MLVYARRVIAVVSPVDQFYDPTAVVAHGVKRPYQPEPTVELELAKLGEEVARALLEVEEVRRIVKPDGLRGRETARLREHQRRLQYVAALRQQHEQSKEAPS